MPLWVLLAGGGVLAYLLLSGGSSSSGGGVASTISSDLGNLFSPPAQATQLGQGGSTTPVGPAASTQASSSPYGGPTGVSLEPSPAPAPVANPYEAYGPAVDASQGMSTYANAEQDNSGGLPAAGMSGTAAGRVGAPAGLVWCTHPNVLSVTNGRGGWVPAYPGYAQGAAPPGGLPVF